MSKQTVIFSFETGNMIDAGTKMWAFNNDQQSPLRFVPGDFRCSHQEASKKNQGIWRKDTRVNSTMTHPSPEVLSI
jgi:hypothetical protein